MTALALRAGGGRLTSVRVALSDAASGWGQGRAGVHATAGATGAAATKRSPTLRSLSVEESRDHPARPGLEHRHHVCSDCCRRVRRSVRRHRLVQPGDPIVGASQKLVADCGVQAVARAMAGCGASEIFSTDQGCPFTSAEFTQPLLTRGGKISLPGRGRALDNGFAERLCARSTTTRSIGRATALRATPTRTRPPSSGSPTNRGPACLWHRRARHADGSPPQTHPAGPQPKTPNQSVRRRTGSCGKLSAPVCGVGQGIQSALVSHDSVSSVCCPKIGLPPQFVSAAVGAHRTRTIFARLRIPRPIEKLPAKTVNPGGFCVGAAAGCHDGRRLWRGEVPRRSCRRSRNRGEGGRPRLWAPARRPPVPQSVSGTVNTLPLRVRPGRFRLRLCRRRRVIGTQGAGKSGNRGCFPPVFAGAAGTRRFVSIRPPRKAARRPPSGLTRPRALAACAKPRAPWSDRSHR